MENEKLQQSEDLGARDFDEPRASSPDPVDGVTRPTGWSAWFGGKNVRIGPRIAAHVAPIESAASSQSDLSSNEILLKQRESEENASIKYRTCSWQKVSRPN
jgi:hypothetical protein